MSETFEPRRVDKPFLGRWIRTTFALLASSPLTFGAVVAVLAILDLIYADVVLQRLVKADLTLVVGALLLPVLWILLSLLSRQADQALGPSELLRLAVSRGVWGFLPGCLLAAVSWLLHWDLSASPVAANVIGSYGWNYLLVVAALGVCYCPLVALAPGLTITEAYHLSRYASRLNGGWVVVTFVAALSLAADGFARAVPAGQVVADAVLVFIGVFSYVAYRDIFERRADYASEAVLAAIAQPRKAPALTRPRAYRAVASKSALACLPLW